MTDITIKRLSYTLNLKRSPSNTFNVSATSTQVLAIKSSGLRGPKGERGDKGDRGEIGPVGSFDDGNLPDFTLIFENQLV